MAEKDGSGWGRRKWLLALCALAAPWTAGCDRRPGAATSSAPAASQPPHSLQSHDNASAESKTKMTDKNADNIETAILAGGCFWGMEDILRKVPGVIDTEVGYAGGTTASPSYNAVKTGTTGHAESIQVTFNPEQLSYADLLENWFFKMHDPTTKNRQGNDRGTQYRSAIFYTTEEQKRVAQEVTKKVDASGFWSDPVVTEIVEAGPFTPAEDYHQDYLEKHPGGYTCHYMRTDPVY